MRRSIILWILLTSLLLAAVLAMRANAAENALPAANAYRAPESALPLGLTGQWSGPLAWPVIAIHAAVLPTGDVLYYSYPNDYIMPPHGDHDHGIGPGKLAKAPPDARSGVNSGSAAMVWDPATSAFNNTFVPLDLFCSGLSLLPNGKLFVTGGNVSPVVCPDGFQGRPETHWFDPNTEAWEQRENMSVGRWYPTNLTLADGSVLILSGLDENCTTTPVMERYSLTSGVSPVPGGMRYVDLYPRLHLLSTGKVAHVAPEWETYRFDPAAPQWEFVATTNAGWRGSAPSVLLPGFTDVVMVFGGETDLGVVSTCEKIDFASPTPSWSFTSPMNAARAHANAVLLPDGNVLVAGGGTSGLYSSPEYSTELYDPQADVWTPLPPIQIGRMYHSTAVLIPDGRVALAGQDSGLAVFTGEIYQPGYLFRGPRPVITSAPGEALYGASFTIGTPQASQITKVVLMGLSTVTHSFNTGQRHVPLAFTRPGPSQLLVTVPSNGNLAPPGYYMLFILNGDDVPSVAAMIRIDSAATPVAPPAGPPALALHAEPNPMRESSRVQFEMPRSGAARLRVVDVAGRVVRSLLDGERPAGRHEARWDGRDAAGAPVPSGRYFYVLSAGGLESQSAVVVVR
ncbi:MAG: galactose oxidase-like domain-containing protein [bacterium]